MLRFKLLSICLIVTCLAIIGCRTSPDKIFDVSWLGYQSHVEDIDIPDVEFGTDVLSSEAAAVRPPSVRNIDDLEQWPLTLEETIQLALANSESIREIGGRIVSSPATTSTIYDPAIQETNPQSGVESALAAFDAQFSTQLLLSRAERKFNNRIQGEGNLALFQRTGLFNAGLTKTSATGTQFSVDHITLYTRNDASTNRFNSVYEPLIQVAVRHPLLRGSGVEFNRIAGPGASPGVYRGVLIARINNDITLADFEASIRNLVRDVERTYWELYFAYRDLEAKKKGRKNALDTWQLEQRRVAAKTRPPDQEAYAREQFYAAQAAVENALSGGSAGTGVLSVESQLRSLLGVPASDGRLIRPTTDPLTADIQFSWEESVQNSVFRRVELRRQRWKVKQRMLELTASRSFRKPQLDLIGGYNWNGFGNHLFGRSSGYKDLFSGQLQGWNVGFDFDTTVGNRVGHAAQRNAELFLRREQALLREQERQIIHELRAAFTELDRAYALSHSNYNRYIAAKFQLDAERKRNEVGVARLDLVLDAQKRTVEAEVAFHRSIADYNLALSQVHFASGTLLDSLEVYLTEGPWTEESHASAVRESLRFKSKDWPPAYVVPAPISIGKYPQRLSSDQLTTRMAPVAPAVEEEAGVAPVPPGPENGSPSPATIEYEK